jgi:acetyltransferase-like isoleucine patch superfamily enzyme
MQLIQIEMLANMPYNLFSRFCSGLHLFKGYFIAFLYFCVPKVWFRSLGYKCCFQGFPRFGYAFRNITIGESCFFGIGIFLNCSSTSYIKIGNHVSINDYTYLSSLYNIEIGDHSRIGEFVSIRDNDHLFSNPDIPIRLQGFHGNPIKIGSNVWIGRGVFIGKGVEIGDGAVIGANSVVTRSIPPFAVAVGAPAKVIKYRTKKVI